MNRLLPSAILLLAPLSALAQDPAIHHGLSVRVIPERNHIEVMDQLTLNSIPTPDENGAYIFLLHEGMRPRILTGGWKVHKTKVPEGMVFKGVTNDDGSPVGQVPLTAWRLSPDSNAREPIWIRYEGNLDHPVEAGTTENITPFTETPGTISASGVFLTGASFWVPTFADGLVTYDVLVSDMDTSWMAVSSGQKTVDQTVGEARSVAWSSTTPSNEVFLVAGPLTETADKAGKVDIRTFTRGAEPDLSARYLEATRSYLDMYGRILSPFPYDSISLVENAWETNYGMPGVAVQGPATIRQPWIVTSSYPHQLVHNWWGSTAMPDPSDGNWAEGLTTYLSDHLLAEQRGDGAAWRRAALQRYTDFVASGDDFPLADYGLRTNASAEAVGYAKAAMLFHMARKAMGDAPFLEALSRFYFAHRWEPSRYADIANAFALTDPDWFQFFEAWTRRTGAPRLKIGEAVVRVPKDGGSWEVEVSITQTQSEEPFPITIPIAVTVEGRPTPVMAEIGWCMKTCRAVVRSPGRPLRLDIDPGFDIMRVLDPMEVPPTLAGVFGGANPTFVLPSSAHADEMTAWKDLATEWVRPNAPSFVMDNELAGLPAGPVWVLGWGNRLAASVVRPLADQGVLLGDQRVTIGNRTIAMDNNSVVLTSRNPADLAVAVAWIAADPVSGIGNLARQIPRYTADSYLAFQGRESENVLRGTWTVGTSPLTRNLASGPLPPSTMQPSRPLAELPSPFTVADLKRIVEALGAPEMEGRGVGSVSLDRAMAFVEARLSRMRVVAAGDGGWRQTWTWSSGTEKGNIPLTNLLFRIPGSNADMAFEPILVMAHLDGLGRGWPTVLPGNEDVVHASADDNASGVAVLMELARTMSAAEPSSRPILFAITSGGEEGAIGSRHLLDNLGNIKPFACINLDSVGRLSTGGLSALDAWSASEWSYLFQEAGYRANLPISMVARAAPLADQKACLDHGIPAIQLNTGNHADYHLPSDTPDRIDADGLVKVAQISRTVITWLAEMRVPLSTQSKTAAQVTATSVAGPVQGTTVVVSTAPKTVGFGAVADFGYPGPGIRVQDVADGSTAQTAGIKPGDILMAIDGDPITGLNAFSQTMRAHKAGDLLQITLQRNGREMRFIVMLEMR